MADLSGSAAGLIDLDDEVEMHNEVSL